MCGRYASTRSTRALAAIFEAEDATGEESLAASYNVAPTDPVHLVRDAGRDTGTAREVRVARWGLLPPWASQPREGARMINARAETLASSRAYREPFARRRCLVPADGWYEWLKSPDGRTRQPYYMTPRDGSVLGFAGLWQLWHPSRRAEGGSPLLTVTVITTEAVGDLRLVHDRMPLALPPSRWSDWLAATGSPERLLRPPGDGWVAGIELRQVGREVGDVRNNSEALIRPVTGSALGVDPAGPADLTLF